MYAFGGFDSLAENAADSAPDCAKRRLPTPAQASPAVDSLTDVQMSNAAIIVRVGQDLGVPRRGLIIAIATSLQEARLYNLPHLGARNDHDSLGLFQQRPSQGWGTAEQISDPIYASGKFYRKLLSIPGWETMPLTVAAQAVQRSAYPGAYAKHEPLATAIVDALADGTTQTADFSAAKYAEDRTCRDLSQAWNSPIGIRP